MVKNETLGQIRRILPNISSDRIDESRKFYTDFVL